MYRWCMCTANIGVCYRFPTSVHVFESVVYNAVATVQLH